MNSGRMLIRAGMIADGDRVFAAPGAIIVDRGRIVASGSPQTVGPVEGLSVNDLPNAVVLPALVNTHCHLDLTHIGPTPFGGEFARWADGVRRRRAIDEPAIEASVRRGIELSRAGGTAIIGDIAGARSLVPLRTLRDAALAGVSFLEVFGLGRNQETAVSVMRQAVDSIAAIENGVRLGLQPHAPYSCGLEVYRGAASMNRPLSTHLAETREELEFVAHASGPLADMIKRIGAWDDSIAGAEQHPIDHLADSLRATPCIAAHLNYIEERHLETLREWPITVAYCPRASAYFGHAAAHRYRDMLAHGVNVALGTDSILCLDTSDRLSTLDEMRFLFRRDGTDPATLLRMGTINGAKALGFDPDLVTLSPGATAGLIALSFNPARVSDPLRQILTHDAPPQWILGPAAAHSSWVVPGSDH
jgi:cytosine/adenosine deaminase-related metal-dependent hydrolase